MAFQNLIEVPYYHPRPLSLVTSSFYVLQKSVFDEGVRGSLDESNKPTFKFSHVFNLTVRPTPIKVRFEDMLLEEMTFNFKCSNYKWVGPAV